VLARIITGWSFAGRQGQLGTPGSFVFKPTRTSRGRSLCSQELREQRRRAGRGGAGGYRAPSSTAKFIATKFARHFVADDPPQPLVAQLQEVFRSRRHLKALTVALWIR